MNAARGLAFAVLLLQLGCGRSAQDAGAGDAPAEQRAKPSLAELPDPELSGMEPQVAELLREARGALLAQPSSAEAWGALGALYDAHGLSEPAETCYRQALARAGEDFRWVYLLAILLEIRGAESDELIERFARAAELKPDYAPIHTRWGDALWRRGRSGEARLAFERALALAPQDALAHRGLGRALLSLGDAASAVTQLSRAAELQPRDRVAHTELAQAYLRLGENARAEESLAIARDLEPVHGLDDPIYGQLVFDRCMTSTRAFSRAMAGMQAGQYAAAIRDLVVVEQARPGDPSVHYWMGTAYHRLGQGDPALRHLRKAVEIAGGMFKARVELGALLLEQGDVPSAVEQFQNALGTRPDDADAHYGLGLAFERLGRADAARREFEAAVRIDPHHPAGRSLAGGGSAERH